jgi:hypothetical protein
VYRTEGRLWLELELDSNIILDNKIIQVTR